MHSQLPVPILPKGNLPAPQSSISGHIHLALVDRRGRTALEHAQDNLILNRMLDELLTSSRLTYRMYPYLAPLLGVDQYSILYGIMQSVAVGTGSSPPAPGDTQLANEIARTSSSLGITPNYGVQYLGAGAFRLYTVLAFDYNQANGNLTEFGLCGNLSAPQVHTRELFRDGNGNPVVITKTSEYRLIITYYITITFSPLSEADGGVVEFRDANNNLVATRHVRHGFRIAWGDWQGDAVMLFTSFYLRNGIYQSYTSGNALLGIAFRTPSDSDPAPDSGNAGLGAYTPGAFTREVRAEMGPTSNDVSVDGYTLGYHISYGGIKPAVRIYSVRFTDATGTTNPFVKGRDYRLGVGLQLTVGR